MNDLLPCPFCGDKNPQTYSDNFGQFSQIVCADCETETAWYDSEEELVAVWNRRADDESKAQEMRKLLSEFAAFSISDYKTLDKLCKDYLALKKRARTLLTEQPKATGENND
ncbi:MAG: Lar family restriction alleviation protein [Burkholderiales bacterium]|jgi:Lar family restriction alleviation protein|nr:Lar family restriction alleviation protein [Burkholderiales bacterium]